MVARTSICWLPPLGSSSVTTTDEFSVIGRPGRKVTVSEQLRPLASVASRHPWSVAHSPGVTRQGSGQSRVYPASPSVHPGLDESAKGL